MDQLEGPVDPHRAHGRARGRVAVELVDELVVVRRPVDREVHDRIEERHDRERRARRGRNLADVPVHVGPQEAAVERDHLPVQAVQRPETEVAVLGQFGERDIAVEVPVEQRVERRRLEDQMRFVLGAAGRPAGRPPRGVRGSAGRR